MKVCITYSKASKCSKHEYKADEQSILDGIQCESSRMLLKLNVKNILVPLIFTFYNFIVRFGKLTMDRVFSCKTQNVFVFLFLQGEGDKNAVLAVDPGCL